MTAAVFEERVDPGQFASALLSAGVHLVLLAILIFGVRWQSRPPESIAVELWEAPPAPVVEAPKPLPKVEPPQPPVVKPEPKPEPARPEPRIEKPEIKLKEPVKMKPAPKPVPQPVLKPVPKPVVKAEPFKPKVDDTQRRIREELAREQASLAIDRERQQIRDQLARDAVTSRSRSTAEYEAKIRNKVRGNIVLPPDIQGNPEALFLVIQLPTGEVLDIKLMRSSGHRGYDAAVERAILKSSPLPKPDRPELFSRELRLTFRPRD
jgi:colicin import membrane protein